VRILDLFCGVGGAGMGYHRAGWDVVGVDIRFQPNYPFPFVQSDALRALRALYEGERLYTGTEYFELADFDAIHASPPCKLFTNMARMQDHVLRLFEPHQDWLTPTREHLETIGLPFVIENVVGAPMRKPILLCGSMFDETIRIRRHRLFEKNWPMARVPRCRHYRQSDVVGVYGDGGDWERTRPGGGGRKVAGPEAAKALGIDWTEHQPELAQAIPPAYTELLGIQLAARLAVSA